MSQNNTATLTEKQRADLKEIFDLADSDGSGAISIQVRSFEKTVTA